MRVAAILGAAPVLAGIPKLPDGTKVQSLGTVTLRGKETSLELFAILNG